MLRCWDIYLTAFCVDVLAGLALILTLHTGCAVGPKDGGSAPLEQASSGIPHQQLPRGEKISLSSFFASIFFLLAKVKSEVPQTPRTPSSSHFIALDLDGWE